MYHNVTKRQNPGIFFWMARACVVLKGSQWVEIPPASPLFFFSYFSFPFLCTRRSKRQEEGVRGGIVSSSLGSSGHPRFFSSLDFLRLSFSSQSCHGGALFFISNTLIVVNWHFYSPFFAVQSERFGHTPFPLARVENSLRGLILPGYAHGGNLPFKYHYASLFSVFFHCIALWTIWSYSL